MPYQNEPFSIQETPGTKHYCTCGESGNKPYCDGSHQELNTGMSPAKVEIPEEKKVFICGCGKSENSPFCDGTHSKL